MVAEKDFKTTAFENSQSHSGSFYGADSSNYNRNYYQVVTLTLLFGVFFLVSKHILAVTGSYSF